MSISPQFPPARRRWFAVSLRGLMLLVLIVGGGLGWYINVVRVQRHAVAVIRKSGGRVTYEWDCVPGSRFNRWSRRVPPGWVIRWFGPDAFGSVVVVTLFRNADDAVMAEVVRLPRLLEFDAYDQTLVTDAQAVALGDLTRLEEIRLQPYSRETPMTGATLAHFANLSQLRLLHIPLVPTRDADLAPISGLTNLESVDLAFTGITDAGLVHLRNLVELNLLGLSSLKLTTAGLTHLERLTKIKILELGTNPIEDLKPIAGLIDLRDVGLLMTPLTDAGLAPVAGWTRLEKLTLGRTKITDAGLNHLSHLASLTELDLSETAITDAGLDVFEGMRSLKKLDVTGTQVSPERLARFRATHPTLVTRGPQPPPPVPAPPLPPGLPSPVSPPPPPG